MKIFLLLPSLGVGGAERQAAALACGLRRAGHESAVLTFYPGGELAADLEGAGVPAFCLDKGGPWDWHGFLPRLVRLLRRERPAFLLGYTGVPNVLTAALKPMVPGMRAVFGLRASDMDLSRYGLLSRLCYGAERRLARRADLIVVNSWAGLEHARRLGYPPDSMRVVPNGIDTQRFRPDPASAARLRSQWGAPGEERLVGLVGRLDPMKDHATFLRAASRLVHARPGTRFACVGDGPRELLDGLRRLEAELGLEGRVVWAGGRQDMPAVYSALDVLCSASAFGEGFSNAVGEAMACGTPCVVTDVGDSARIVAGTGLAVPPCDPAALAQALEVMLARLDAQGCAPGQAARARIEAEFAVDRMVLRTIEALESVCAV